METLGLQRLPGEMGAGHDRSGCGSWDLPVFAKPTQGDGRTHRQHLAE